MSCILSALRRVAGIEVVQDICALLATGAVILVAYYACAGIVMWRAGL